MALRFERYRNGFDEQAKPPWMMVPLKGENHCYLKKEKGVQISVKSGAGRVKLLTKDSKVTVKGLRAGKAVLQAKRGKKVLAELEVDVLRKMTIKAALWLVREVYDGKAVRKTKLGKQAARKELEQASKRLEKEANVVLKPVAVNTLPVRRYLGETVDEHETETVTDAAEPYWIEYPLIWATEWYPERKADVYVFFVWKIYSRLGAYRRGTKAAFVQDYHRKYMDEVIIHEVGHFTGLKHHPDKNNVMYKDLVVTEKGKTVVSTSDFRLDRDQILNHFRDRSRWGRKPLPKKKQKKPRGARKAKTHRVAPGETLTAIARKRLKDPSRYMEIFNLNAKKNGGPLTSPNEIKKGQILKLPPDAVE